MTDILRLLREEERGRLEQYFRQRALATPGPTLTYAGDTTLFRVFGEWVMLGCKQDLSIVPHLALDGFWELWITMWMARKLRPGMRCVDVGANLGYYTVLMGRAVGSEGHVTSYEPMMYSHASLMANWRLNGRFPATLHDHAAGATRGRADLFMPTEWNNLGGCSVAQEFAGSTPDRVPVSPLDEIAHAVDLIKIDVEGYEPAVWAGMQGLLARSPNVEILMEFTPRLYADPAGFLDAISRDWVVSAIGPESLVVPVSRDRLLGLDDLENLHLTRRKP